MKFKGKWVARVEQEFEVEADDEESACKLVEQEILPGNVIELLDMEVAEIREVEG